MQILYIISNGMRTQKPNQDKDKTKLIPKVKANALAMEELDSIL